jgi:uncharacterized membrane protein
MFGKRKQQYPHQFIAAGLFIGMGIGMIFDALVVGLFLGLGAGFLCSAIANSMKKHE